MDELRALPKLAQRDDQVMVNVFRAVVHDQDSQVVNLAKQMIQADMVAFKPDVNVYVEDEMFKVSVLVIGFASPVLQQMITSMNRIDLGGMSKDQFVVFKEVIEYAFHTFQGTNRADFGLKVDATNVDFLLEWFEIFQVHQSGKRACEQTLLKIPILPSEGSERLRQVDNFGLSMMQRERCEYAILRQSVEEALAAVPCIPFKQSALQNEGQAPVSGKKARFQRKLSMQLYRMKDRQAASASRRAGPKGLALDGIDLLI